MIDYDYRAWIVEKIVENLPSSRVKMGDKYYMKCPICGDSHKNALKKRGTFYTSTAKYHCFNCDVTLSGMKFLEVLTGSAYEDIKKEYIKMKYNGRNIGLSADWSLQDEKKQAKDLFSIKPILNPSWKNPLTEDAKEYLSKRLVDKAPFLKEPMYSCSSKDGKEYIVIPWVINGIDGYYQVNDFKKYGSIKYIFPRDKEKLIYGLDNIDISWPYIILFEGVYDSLFVKNAIAIGGKSLTAVQRELISKRFPRHQIVFALDNDKAGLSNTTKMIMRSGNSYKFFKWFDAQTKAKDINDYVLESGNVNIFTDKSKLEEMIISSVMMKMYLVDNNLFSSRENNGQSKRKEQREVLKGEKWDLSSIAP